MRRDEVLALTKNLKARLIRDLGEPVEVLLFGSYARGTELEGSDVDVLVILPRLNRRIRDIVWDIAWEVGFEAGVVISAIPITFEERERFSDSPFLKAVEDEGIKV